MSKKQIPLLVGAALGLILVGSIAGAGIYAYFFAPKYVYLPSEPLPATFSRFTESGQRNEGNGRDFRGQDTRPAESSRLREDLPDFVRSAEQSRPAVVHIKSRVEARQRGDARDFFSNPFRDFFDEEGGEIPQSLATGSGVLISPDGYIATNNHVIEDASTVEVTLFDNRTFTARIIGTDLSTDLALLKIEGDNFPNLRFGDSDDIHVGEWVLAVGNPMDLTSTVTAGIVSAKGRNIDLLRNDSKYAIESFIQTDAAVNKGNSGGALVNLRGELVGINTAIASRTGYYAGYSFAIPSTIARKVMEDLLSYGEVRRGYLGVTIRPVTAELAEAEGLSVLKGAFVTDLNSELGAVKAGIKEGDVIISVNEVPVSSSSELQEQVSRYRPGDKIAVMLYRGTKQLTFSVELMGIEADAPPAMRSSLEYRGSFFRLPTEDEYEELDISHGVMVEQAGNRLSQNGIQKGFLLTEIDGQNISTIEDLENALLDAGDYVTIKGLYSKGMVASYSFAW